MEVDHSEKGDVKTGIGFAVRFWRGVKMDGDRRMGIKNVIDVQNKLVELGESGRAEIFDEGMVFEFRIRIDRKIENLTGTGWSRSEN
jgi:hypothetical protein